MSERVFVHLDHLIQREDIHYTHTGMARVAERAVKKDDIIRFVDIQEGRGIYPRLRKPDFQRQTNAWTPEKCVEFLDSLLRGWLIPHIILWQKPGTDLISAIFLTGHIEFLLFVPGWRTTGVIRNMHGNTMHNMIWIASLKQPRSHGIW